MECQDHCRCNKYYVIISIVLFLILFLWNILITRTINYNPAYINSFNYPPERVEMGEYITFDTNRVIETGAITHEEGSTEFVVNETGTYYVHFNTTVYEPPSTGKESTLSVYLEHNYATVYGTTVGETVTNAYQTVNLDFAVMIEANRGDILKIKNNSGTVVELLQPNINIIKIK